MNEAGARRVAVIAAALRERGIRAGDRVAIMMTNRPEFLETMFAGAVTLTEIWWLGRSVPARP